MREFIENPNMSKEKKISLSIGLLMCVPVFSAAAVFSFYSSMNTTGSFFIGAGQACLVGSYFLGGAAFFHNSNKTPENQVSTEKDRQSVAYD